VIEIKHQTSNIKQPVMKNTGTTVRAFGLILSLGALPLVGGLTGCAGNRFTQSTGEHIDDRADSSRAKSF
jgi:hypothetical protein